MALGEHEQARRGLVASKTSPRAPHAKQKQGANHTESCFMHVNSISVARTWRFYHLSSS